MYQSELQESLKRLYNQPDHARITSLISGPWGIGKTFSVNMVLKVLSDTAQPRAWYYLSVFGKSSINDLLESMWLEVLKKNVGIKDKRVGAVAKYLRSAFDIFKGQFAGVASAISTLQKSMLDDIIQEDTILIIDDLERKSPSLEMVDLLGFIEMYREKCSIVAIGNTAGIESEEKKVFGRYAERLFDQQYILTDISAEVLELVMNKNVGAGVSAEVRKLIIASFGRSKDSNMRTLLKIGIVVTEAFHQLAEHDKGDLLESKDFIPTIVALMIEKHSKGKDIAPLSLDRSWIVPDDATSTLVKEYSLPTRIGFSLAPFVELIEHKRLNLDKLDASLGVQTFDELETAFHSVIYYWCHSIDLIKNAWAKVSQAMEGASISRFTLREIVDFAHASTSLRALVPDLFDDREFEPWILDRLSAAARDSNHGILVSQLENITLGYEALREKPLIDKMTAIVKREALLRRSSTLKAQFDVEYGEGQFYRAFRLVEDSDFPTAEISENLARSGDESIPDDYFFALRTLIKDLRVPESRRIVTEKLSGILHDSKDPVVQARIQALLGTEKTDKT